MAFGAAKDFSWEMDEVALAKGGGVLRRGTPETKKSIFKKGSVILPHLRDTQNMNFTDLASQGSTPDKIL